MTWGRTFPDEPKPSTRDLVVFTATIRAVKKRLAVLSGSSDPTDETGVFYGDYEPSQPGSSDALAARLTEAKPETPA